MIEQLFTSLSSALSSNLLLASLAAFSWGILSILLSPCHLSSVPLIVGYISKQEEMNKKNAFIISSVFSLGILLTIAVVGLITASMGRIMGDIGTAGNYFLGVVLFLVGLYLMDVIPLPSFNLNVTQNHRKGIVGAIILGILFGSALGPCTFAFFAPVLGIIIKISGESLLFAVIILLAFSIGHVSVIITAGTLTSKLRALLNWSQESKSLLWLKRICGILVITGAVYLVYKSF